MSANITAASTSWRRTGWSVTSAQSSVSAQISRSVARLRSSRYSGSERPAWRMNHTGVRSTGSRRAALTRIGSGTNLGYPRVSSPHGLNRSRYCRPMMRTRTAPCRSCFERPSSGPTRAMPKSLPNRLASASRPGRNMTIERAKSERGAFSVAAIG